MSTITVGIPTTASSAAGVGVGASSGGYKTFICFSNPCNGNGLLSTLAAHIHNDTGSPVSARFITYACTDLGGGNYQITQRARTGAYSIAKGTDGLTAIYSQSLEVHKTDVIGLQIYFPIGSYDFEDVFTVYGGDGYTPRYYTIVTGTFTSKTVNAGVSDPFIIYGSGDSYSGEGGSGGGGIGGNPKSACHDVTETVTEDESSTGLWGVVTPRDFGLSGGKDAAYVDLTFPWDTAGDYTESEIFVDGVNKGYDNPTNPMEHYTLQMDVFRYNGISPLTMTNVKELSTSEDTDTWGLIEFNGYLYAGLGKWQYASDKGELFRSSNGTSWTSVWSSSTLSIACLCVHDSYLYMSLSGGAMKRSSDGITWTDITSPGIYVNDMVSFGSYLYVGCYYGGHVVRRSTDGSTWTTVVTFAHSNGTTNRSFAKSSTRIYISQGSGYIYNTTDGTTWTEVDGSRAVNRIHYFGSYLWGNVGGTLYRSSDNGATWSSSIATGEADIWGMCNDGTNMCFGTGDHGKIYILSGSTWYLAYSFGSYRIDKVAVFNSILYVGLGYHSIVYKADRGIETVATGRVYDFHECWWIEATNGDVYVAPATGNNSNLGFSWDEAYATLQKGLDEVGNGGVVHVKCHTTVHTVSNISDSKIIKPYTEGSYNKIYITK